MNRNNFIGERSSTRVHAAPGGRSSFSLGWSGEDAQKPQTQQKQEAPAKNCQEAAADAAMAAPSNPCHARAVREFTRACDQPTPNTPQLMSREEVTFITKMVIDELLELNATVMSPSA